MATKQPQATRGTGGDPSNPPLAQGEATQLNEGAQAAREEQGQPAAQGGPPPETSPEGGTLQEGAQPEAGASPDQVPAPAGPRDAPVNFQPQSDDERFLYGASTDSSGAATAPSPTDRTPLPPQVVQALPLIQQLTQDPQASAQTTTLFRLLAQHAQER